MTSPTPAHKTRKPLFHPDQDISPQAVVVWSVFGLWVVLFLFLYFVWIAS